MKCAFGGKLVAGLMFDWSMFVCQVGGRDAVADAKKERVGLDALSIMGLQKRATNELQEREAEGMDRIVKRG